MRACLLAVAIAGPGAAATASTWPSVDETKLAAGTGGEAWDFFGIDVAASGDTGLVGSSGEDPGGAAYLFDMAGGAAPARLTAPGGASGDSFGISVDIDGGTAIVGSTGYDDFDASLFNIGAAHLFDTATGTATATLNAFDPASGDLFGRSVAISGATAIVGSPNDDDMGNDSGSAYLFNVTDGSLLRKLTAGDGAAGDQFGFSVDVDGTVAIVGSLNDDDEGSNSGSAYLFDVSTGQLLHKLTAGDGAAGDQFGYSVAISGETAIVGSRYDDLSRGAAYLFDVTSGQQIAKLVADDGESGDAFGWSVDIDGDTAVVGSYTDDTGGGPDAGSAYLFDVPDGAQIARLTGSDGLQGDQFGYSVAISGDLVVAGSLLGDGSQVDSGAAYAFTPVPLPAGAWLLLSGLGVLALARPRRTRAG